LFTDEAEAGDGELFWDDEIYEDADFADNVFDSLHEDYVNDRDYNDWTTSHLRLLQGAPSATPNSATANMLPTSVTDRLKKEAPKLQKQSGSTGGKINCLLNNWGTLQNQRCKTALIRPGRMQLANPFKFRAGYLESCEQPLKKLCGMELAEGDIEGANKVADGIIALRELQASAGVIGTVGANGNPNAAGPNANPNANPTANPNASPNANPNTSRYSQYNRNPNAASSSQSSLPNSPPTSQFQTNRESTAKTNSKIMSRYPKMGAGLIPHKTGSGFPGSDSYPSSSKYNRYPAPRPLKGFHKVSSRHSWIDNIRRQVQVNECLHRKFGLESAVMMGKKRIQILEAV